MFKIFLQTILILLILGTNIACSKIKSGLCEPYFASIKSNNANAHNGPGMDYKVSWAFIAKYLPVLIIAKYDHWRQIIDPNGEKSWIHKNLLSPKRFIITEKDCPIGIFENSKENSQVIAYAKKNVIMELLEIRGNWCKISTLANTDKRYSGWVRKENVFGSLENETQ